MGVSAAAQRLKQLQSVFCCCSAGMQQAIAA
jgi:hypothetical protein